MRPDEPGWLTARRTRLPGPVESGAVRDLASDLAIVIGAFAAATLIAEAAGAANLGTALSFGQIGFAIALVVVLVKR
jgi:hypothetical protein